MLAAIYIYIYIFTSVIPAGCEVGTTITCRIEICKSSVTHIRDLKKKLKWPIF